MMRFHLATVVLLAVIGGSTSQLEGLTKLFGGLGSGGGNPLAGLPTDKLAPLLGNVGGDIAGGVARQTLKCGDVLIGKPPKDREESKCVKDGIDKLLGQFTKGIPSFPGLPALDTSVFTKDIETCKKENAEEKKPMPLEILESLITTGKLDLDFGKKCKDCFDAEQEACYEVLKGMCKMMPALDGGNMDIMKMLAMLGQLTEVFKAGQRVQEVKTAHDACRDAMKVAQELASGKAGKAGGGVGSIESLFKNTGTNLFGGALLGVLGRGGN